MVTAKFCMNDLTMDVDGHAQAKKAEDEFDLVCCAVSYATQALIYYLEEWKENRGGIDRMDLEYDKGHIHLHIVAQEYARPGVKRIMEFTRKGLEMLEEKYEKHITVTEE